MTITPDKCPVCGEEVMGTCDLIPGCALLIKNDDKGTYQYEGETKVFWDGQVNSITFNREAPIQNSKGEDLSYVQCHNGHEWEAVIDE